MNNQILFQGDCLEIMKEIPDKSIDLILCDLPYGTTACKWDVIIPFDKLWSQYERIIKPSGIIVLFASQPFTTMMISSNLKDYRYNWIWDKKKPGAISIARFQPLRVYEDICVFYRQTGTYNPQKTKREKPIKYKNYSQSHITGPGIKAMVEFKVTDSKYPKNILEFSNANQTEKVHPTQKPVALLEYLIKTYTNANEIVLDNTMGSGSTGVACVNTERDFIGIEKDEKYFAIAEDRITKAVKELETKVVDVVA